MKIVSLQQFDIQMMPNGNLICLIMLAVSVNYVFLAVLGAELTMASNQHPLPTVTVGDWSFQHCPRHLTIVISAGEEEVRCVISLLTTGQSLHDSFSEI